MKIIGLKIQPIASVFAAIYAAFGAFFWLSYCIGRDEYIILPVGVIGPLLHLNINLSFHRSSAVLPNLLFFLGSLVTYALSGWLTAAIAVLCFNAIAKMKHDIDADFIRLREPRKTESLVTQ